MALTKYTWDSEHGPGVSGSNTKALTTDTNVSTPNIAPVTTVLNESSNDSNNNYVSSSNKRGSNYYADTLYEYEDDMPEAYSSKYTSQIDSILDKILNRESFDINNDANYQQLYNTYKESYQNQARKSMQEALGSAQAASGGYGNSYAAAVGQQAYDDTMSQLNDQNINLMNMAYGMYSDEIADNYNQLGAVNNQDNIDYSRYRDTVNDYYTNRDYYANRYQTEYGNEFAEDQYEYSKNQDALNAAMSLASNGITVPAQYAAYLDDDTVSQLNALAGQAVANRYKSGGSGSGSGNDNSDYYDKLYRIEQGALSLKEQQKSLTDSQKYNYYKAIRNAGYSDEEAADVYKELGIGTQLLKKFKNGNK